MNTTKSFLQFSIFFLLTTTALYGQITGGDIDYRCLGQGRYEIFANLEEVCGNPHGAPIIRIEAGQNKLTADSISLTGITPLFEQYPNCSYPNTCNYDSITPVILRKTYRGVVDLSNITACDVRFYVQEGSVGLGNTYGNRDSFYIHTRFNRCLLPCDSSARLKTPLKSILLHGQDYSDYASYESADPDERLTFRIDTLRNGLNQNVSYSGTFSPGRFVTFFGFPNQHLQWPAGLHLDDSTGWIAFRPTQSGQISGMALHVTRWRKISGQYTEVGSQLLEHTYFVRPAGTNKAPVILPPSSAEFCSGRNSCIRIRTDDSDAQDSVKLEIQHNIPGLTVQYFPGLHEEAEICWNPDTQYVSNLPWTLTARATDNACPARGTGVRVYSLFVRRTPEASPSISPSGNCGQVILEAQPSSAISTMSALWILKDSLDKTIEQRYGLQHSLHLSSGKYKTELILKNFGCETRYMDSFTIQGSDYPLLTLSDSILEGCYGDTATIGVYGSNGNYSISWADGYTDSLRFIRFSPDTPLYRLITVNGQCTRTDSFLIFADSGLDMSFYLVWQSANSVRFSLNNPVPNRNYYWYLDNQTSPVQGSSVTLQLDGSVPHKIRVEANNGWCKSIADSTVSPFTGIGISADGKVSVYPNPFGTRLHIRANNLSEAQLFDATGRMIPVTLTENDDETLLDTETELSPGLYWLVVNQDDKRSVLKLRKE